MPTSVGRRVTLTVSTLAPGAYSAPHVFARNRDPYTIYGYEAMKLILDGLNAGGASKEGVLAFLRGVQNRASGLGTYSFDANGDTTLGLTACTRSGPLAALGRSGDRRLTGLASAVDLRSWGERHA